MLRSRPFRSALLPNRELPAGQAEETAALFREVCPECEVTLIDGGQPVYYYLISAE